MEIKFISCKNLPFIGACNVCSRILLGSSEFLGVYKNENKNNLMDVKKETKDIKSQWPAGDFSTVKR